jgi:hypothetical protein
MEELNNKQEKVQTAAAKGCKLGRQRKEAEAAAPFPEPGLVKKKIPREIKKLMTTLGWNADVQSRSVVVAGEVADAERPSKRGRKKKSDDGNKGNSKSSLDNDGQVPVLMRDGVTTAVGDIPSALKDPDDIKCAKCDRKDADDLLILCEIASCCFAKHTFCCDPMLACVPKKAWLCPQHKVKKQKQNIVSSGVEIANPPLEAVVVAAPNAPPVKKRGRPRIHPLKIKGAPKKRGRPPLVVVNHYEGVLPKENRGMVEQKEVLVEEAGRAVDITVAEISMADHSQVVLPKKKRGRVAKQKEMLVEEVRAAVDIPAVDTPLMRSSDDSDSDEIKCAKCDREDMDEILIVCDVSSCSCALHTFCCDPPLDCVPKGEWRCPGHARTKNKKKNKKNKVSSSDLEFTAIGDDHTSALASGRSFAKTSLQENAQDELFVKSCMKV